MPPCLIEFQNSMRTRRNMEGDFLKMQAHRFAVAAGQHDATPPLPSAKHIASKIQAGALR
jgi:hypothetical protein